MAAWPLLRRVWAHRHFHGMGFVGVALLVIIVSFSTIACRNAIDRGVLLQAKDQAPPVVNVDSPLDDVGYFALTVRVTGTGCGSFNSQR